MDLKREAIRLLHNHIGDIIELTGTAISKAFEHYGNKAEEKKNNK